jgi:hypothetical protein
VLRQAAIAGVIAAALFLVADAVIFNPSGFRARVAFLLGPASQDFVHYTNDWSGRWLVVKDIAENFTRYYPFPFAALAALGLVLACAGAWARKGERGGRLVAALLPLLFAASFTACFNCVARRTDHRFALPQHVLFAVYMGIAVARLTAIEWRPARVLARGLFAITFARALFEAASVDAALVLDPRYDAEAWLEEHAKDGDGIEVHALNVYLPRFPARTKVVRVAPGPVDKRNPLPDVTEVQDTYANIDRRRPRFVVVSQGWVWRYLLDPQMHLEKGRILPPTQKSTGSEADGSAFFRGLVSGQRGYREAYKATWKSKIFPRIDMHASTGQEVWIYERVD